MRTEHQDAASLNVLMAPGNTAWQLQPGVARGIAGRLCGIADLVLLSLALIYRALWASGIQAGDNVIALLSMRISLGHFAALALCWVVWRTIFSYCGLYAWQHVRSVGGTFGRVLAATGISALVAGRVIATLWHHGYFLQNTLYFWLSATCGVLILRTAIAGFCLYVRPHFRQNKNAVVVGTGSRAESVCNELISHPEWAYKFLGFVDSNPWAEPGTNEGMLGRINDLEDILMRQIVDEVVIVLSAKSQYAAIERTISICERVGVQVQYCEDLFDRSRPGCFHREEYDHRKVVMKMVHDDYRRQVKRAFDIAGSLFGLILFAPLFLLVAVLIKCTSMGPVFFRQERHGLNKRTFRIYKFRTMVENAEAGQVALEHLNQNSGPVFKIFKDPRVTKVGAFLRRTSIDELPQLLNILRGDMSFVGPRPLNKRDVGRFSEAWLMRRFSVKPGLTCLWQVSGRSNVSFDRWIALDLYYIDHWSLHLDLRILAMTFPAVLKGTGAA
jgi:exopolysaccharide biosynthesis polyprenyl glycosylphosphotransferase